MGFDYKARVETKITDQPIGKLLDTLRMESVFFTQSTLTKPWSVTMPEIPNCMMFHIVVEGMALFEVAGSTFKLNAGDFVLFPKGEGHLLSDGECQYSTNLADLPIVSVTERFETLEFGGGGDATHMVCGVMLFQHPLAIKLLGILPSYIIIDRDTDGSTMMIGNISELLKTETQTIGVGAKAVIARLADILVIAAMRQYLTELNEDKIGWLGALSDDRIGNALKLIHENPAEHWSLEDLATKVGMSRTSFAQLFKRLVGNTPMDYLTEWRMSLAYSKLQLTKESVLAIALDIGYQSEAAFSRAFKKIIGKSPGEVRKAYQLPG